MCKVSLEKRREIFSEENREDMEKEEGLYLTESNVMDVYKKLINKSEIDSEEKTQVLRRFYELVNYK